MTEEDTLMQTESRSHYQAQKKHLWLLAQGSAASLCRGLSWWRWKNNLLLRTTSLYISIYHSFIILHLYLSIYISFPGCKISRRHRYLICPVSNTCNTKIRLMDCLIWTQSGSWNAYHWISADMIQYRLQLFGAGNVCADLSSGISKLLYDLYSKVRGKGRFSVAASSLLVTRWEVCCFRCLKNNIWEREHAPGTSSFVGFECLTAENLQCWLTEEGRKCFVLSNALLVKGNLAGSWTPLFRERKRQGACKIWEKTGHCL